MTDRNAALARLRELRILARTGSYEEGYLDAVADYARHLTAAGIFHGCTHVAARAAPQRETHWTDCPNCGGQSSPFNDDCTGYTCSKCGRDHWPTAPLAA